MWFTKYNFLEEWYGPLSYDLYGIICIYLIILRRREELNSVIISILMIWCDTKSCYYVGYCKRMTDLSSLHEINYLIISLLLQIKMWETFLLFCTDLFTWNISWQDRYARSKSDHILSKRLIASVPGPCGCLFLNRL